MSYNGNAFKVWELFQVPVQLLYKQVFKNCDLRIHVSGADPIRMVHHPFAMVHVPTMVEQRIPKMVPQEFVAASRGRAGCRHSVGPSPASSVWATVVGVDGRTPVPNVKVRQRVKPFGLNVGVVLVNHWVGHVVLRKPAVDWAQV